MERLKTGISKAYWCERRDGDRTFEPAMVLDRRSEHLEDEYDNTKAEGRGIAWFDELFEGGIVIPSLVSDKKRAVTLLISGPPGSGKSTLALELVCRLRQVNNCADHEWHVLYVTSESCGSWLKEKAESYGWPSGPIHIHHTKDKQVHSVPPIAHVDIIETDKIKTYLENSSSDSMTGNIFGILMNIMGRRSRHLIELMRRIYFKKLRKSITGDMLFMNPDILVVDSLNTVEETDRSELFNRFTELTSAGPKIIVLIMDTATPRTHRGTYEFWAYECDTIIRLDKRYDSDYMVRTIEIEKARHQSHIWGVHQLKIYGPNLLADLQRKEEDPRRAHPYREEGGVFIFPSIHYYLSSYKRKSPPDKPEPVDTIPVELNCLLHDGLPEERCTGLVGERGNHKSHLGYVHVLYRILKHQERGLIISLRDGEGVARTTLQRILKEQEEFKDFRDVSLEALENKDSLEILYYPPGYITPEEFYHRMYLSVQRLKWRNPNPKITLLFNSLDQLGARFPLCAKEQVFIPGIIETLCAERITSLFIGVNEPGQPEEQYGLLSMADLVISFEKRTFHRKDYMGHLDQRIEVRTKQKIASIRNKLKKSLSIKPRAVVLCVERFAGGQTAGRGGILELVSDDSPLHEFYGRTGLCFTEFSPDFSEGFKPIVGLSPSEGESSHKESDDGNSHKN